MESRRGGSPVKDWGVVFDARQPPPFRAGVFPVVLCMRLWQHIGDASERKAILDLFHHATSDWVILSYYQSNPIHVLQRRLRPRLKRLSMLSRGQFVDEIRSSGFECVDVIPLMRGIHAQHVALLRKS